MALKRVFIFLVLNILIVDSKTTTTKKSVLTTASTTRSSKLAGRDSINESRVRGREVKSLNELMSFEAFTVRMERRPLTFLCLKNSISHRKSITKHTIIMSRAKQKRQRPSRKTMKISEPTTTERMRHTLESFSLIRI